MTREEAIKENIRRREAETEVFDTLCTDLTSLPLRKLKIYNPDRANACQNDELVAGRKYLVVRDGQVYLGSATKSWFGWQFHTDSYLMQLNHVDMVFEIDFPKFPTEPLGRVEVPKAENTSEFGEDDDCFECMESCTECPYK